MKTLGVELLVPFILLFSAALSSGEKPNALPPATLEAPKGLPPVPCPEDNPYSKEKAELGRLLFFDKRLSSEGTVSCSSCHCIPKAFTDHHTVSTGIERKKGIRNAPSIINSAYQPLLFWDGRAKSLEDQTRGPLTNCAEMTDSSDPHEALHQCHERIQNIQGYRDLFRKVFGTDECSMDHVAKAVASFERTILSGNSPYDRYLAGEKAAITRRQARGLSVFTKAGCVNCHLGANFTDYSFKNIGIGMQEKNPDLGRFIVTKEKRDWGAFKVPTLREVANTYPYMHDGSLRSLLEVVEYYDKGGTPNENLHPLMRPLHLTEQQKHDLVSFLHSLSGEGWQNFEEPTEFPL